MLDTLKPMEPNIIEMANSLSTLSGVSAVNISKDIIEDMGGSIHSIDEVVAGKMIIDDAATLQD